jgi:membrane protease subunit (stomatin/prohibitin family)
MALNRLIDEIEATVLAKLRDKFDAVGLTLKAFEMTPLSAAKTTAEDLRGMGLLDVSTYQALQAADAMRDAAQNPGGAASAGVGFGAGISLGQSMASALAGGQKQAASGGEVGSGAPTSAVEIQSLLDSLDLRLAKGEIDQATYGKLTEKWQARLKDMK